MPDVKTFKIETPWDVVRLPEYRVFSLGKWRLRRTPAVPNAPGYWFPDYGDDRGFALQKRENKGWRTWMSLTPMELQSQQPHIAAAKGNVIVAGLGMGLYLFNILAKPEVHKVLVCEVDPDIIKVFDRITAWRTWPGADKLEIRECDARKLQLQTGADFTVDYLYVDIWETLGTDLAHLEVQNMVKGIRPQAVSYWGQEIDFGTFLLQNKLPFDRRTSLSHWAAFRDTLGVPLSGADWGMYPRFAGAATCLQTMGSTRLSEGDKNKCFMHAMSMLGALDGLGLSPASGSKPSAERGETGEDAGGV